MSFKKTLNDIYILLKKAGCFVVLIKILLLRLSSAANLKDSIDIAGFENLVLAIS
jgi:hypothetical protein